MASKRVAWVVSHPIQYQVPVLRELTAMKDVELTALFLTPFGGQASHDPEFGVTFEWDVPMLDGYRSQLVDGHREGPPLMNNFFSVFASGIGAELAKGYDAVVVSGYAFAGYAYAIQQAHRLGQRVILLSESTLEDRPRSFAKRAIKAALFRLLFRAGDHGLAPGSRSRRYLEHCGIAAERIHDYPYCVDTRLTDEAWGSRDALRQECRAKLGIPPEAVAFLYCGKLIPKKDPLSLMRAFNALRGEAHLIWVGSGELEDEVRALAGQRSDVHFVGFRNQTELPQFYAAADAVVLPSIYETWGLVVNEAMAMGCAAIVSDRVGSCADLVEGKDTGLVVPVENDAALREALQHAVDHRPELARWQANARGVVASYTPAQAALGVREAVFAE